MSAVTFPAFLIWSEFISILPKERDEVIEVVGKIAAHYGFVGVIGDPFGKALKAEVIGSGFIGGYHTFAVFADHIFFVKKVTAFQVDQSLSNCN